MRGGPVLCSKGGWYDSLLGNVRRFKGSSSGGKVMDVNTQIKLELLLGTPDT